MRLELQHQIAKKVPCRFCGQTIGDYCVTLSGGAFTENPHKIRIEDYYKAIGKPLATSRRKGRKLRENYKVISDWFNSATT